MQRKLGSAYRVSCSPRTPALEKVARKCTRPVKRKGITAPCRCSRAIGVIRAHTRRTWYSLFHKNNAVHPPRAWILACSMHQCTAPGAYRHRAHGHPGQDTRFTLCAPWPTSPSRVFRLLAVTIESGKISEKHIFSVSGVRNLELTCKKAALEGINSA